MMKNFTRFFGMGSVDGEPSPSSSKLVKVISCIAFLICLVSFTNAQTLRPSQISGSVGIAGKAIDTPEEYDEVVASGAKIVRRGFDWPAIETTQGVYNWGDFDPIVEGLNDKGITVMGILTYGNSNYPPIYTEAGRQAFGDYCADVVEHYKDADVIWEIYNEPNLEQFWGSGAGNNSDLAAEEYTALAKVAIAKIKAVVPGATVLAPSMAGVWSSSFRWLAKCIENGLLDSGLDALAFHGYPAANRYFPELHDKSTSDGYIPLMHLLDSLGYSDIPLYHTEVGSSLDKLEPIGVPANEVEIYQAWHMARTMMIDRKWNIRATIWYLWSSSSNNSYAMVSDGVKRPVYYAMKAMNEQLDGYDFVEQISLADPDDYVFRFENEAGVQKLVVWTAPNESDPAGQRIPSPHDVALPVDGSGALNVYDYLGNVSSAPISNGQITIHLDGGPKYIELNNGLPGPWKNADVGGVEIAGTANVYDDKFTVQGNGSDIWGSADEFHYVYQPITGNMEITARITYQEHTNDSAKAGVMIREDLSPGSKYAFSLLTGSGGSSWQARSVTDGMSEGGAGPADEAPVWVKIKRRGNRFIEYRSEDGTNWTKLSSQVIGMSRMVYVGLAVTSHNDQELGTVTFDNVSVRSLRPGLSTSLDSMSFNYASESQDLEIISNTLWIASDDADWINVSPSFGVFGGTLSITVSDNPLHEERTGTIIIKSFKDRDTVIVTQAAMPVMYNLSTSVTGQGTIVLDPPGGTYLEGTEVKVTATPDPGYRFDGWSGDAGGYTNPLTIPMNADKEITALFVESPWLNQDIGSVGIAGNALIRSDTFTIEGSGADIWGSSDKFHYVYQPVSGDVEIVAKIIYQENTKYWAKAGVMIREDLTAGSKNAFSMLTGSGGSSWQARTNSGGSSIGGGGPLDSAPLWLKVVRADSIFTEYRSTDGVNWTVLQSQSISMSEDVYVGLAVTSHDNAQLGTAIFTNVSVTVSGGGAGARLASDPLNLQDKELKIYPNPARDFLHVEGIKGPAKATVTSLSRPFVKEVTITNGQLDITDLKEGVYLIQVNHRHFRIIKE